jgi:hypothetical protein
MDALLERNRSMRGVAAGQWRRLVWHALVSVLPSDIVATHIVPRVTQYVEQEPAVAVASTAVIGHKRPFEED